MPISVVNLLASTAACQPPLGCQPVNRLTENPRPDERSSLVIRNVKVHGHRTSVRREVGFVESGDR